MVSCFEPVPHFSIVFTETAPRLSNICFQDVAAGAFDTYMHP